MENPFDEHREYLLGNPEEEEVDFLSSPKSSHESHEISHEPLEPLKPLESFESLGFIEHFITNREKYPKWVLATLKTVVAYRTHSNLPLQFEQIMSGFTSLSKAIDIGASTQELETIFIDELPYILFIQRDTFIYIFFTDGTSISSRDLFGSQKGQIDQLGLFDSLDVIEVIPYDPILHVLVTQYCPFQQTKVEVPFKMGLLVCCWFTLSRTSHKKIETFWMTSSNQLCQIFEHPEIVEKSSELMKSKKTINFMVRVLQQNIDSRYGLQSKMIIRALGIYVNSVPTSCVVSWKIIIRFMNIMSTLFAKSPRMVHHFWTDLFRAGFEKREFRFQIGQIGTTFQGDPSLMYRSELFMMDVTLQKSRIREWMASLQHSKTDNKIRVIVHKGRLSIQSPLLYIVPFVRFDKSTHPVMNFTAIRVDHHMHQPFCNIRTSQHSSSAPNTLQGSSSSSSSSSSSIQNQKTKPSNCLENQESNQSKKSKKSTQPKESNKTS
jgi:hypothetical protein